MSDKETKKKMREGLNEIEDFTIYVTNLPHTLTKEDTYGFV